MADTHTDDDFAPSQTSGYKPGEKKSLQEYETLDAEDESLTKWKASLGIGKAGEATATDDPRRVIVEHIALQVQDRPDVIVDLSSKRMWRDSKLFDFSRISILKLEALEEAKSTPFTIKEGVEYRIKVRFRVQHEIVSGLKYLQVVKRHGLRGEKSQRSNNQLRTSILDIVDKTEEMIGSYGPSAEAYEKQFHLEEAPSGILARGHYEAKSAFIDDDGVTHVEWDWSFDIKKQW
ncbi:hypothetical protein EC973_002636 [Apophysomyces ossiformis]|uniref:Rho GDP-dissociation inhibitor n=1 Tax=Apophysomyces ossiformis TaxID=679940 RepID=A0A8H7BS90_9FUNG|nr:hypothetical protein EC973_002636 [Apophysomyces ossiformis]